MNKILEFSKGMSNRQLREILMPEKFEHRSIKQAIALLRKGKVGAFDIGELAGFAMTLAELGIEDRS